MGLPAGEEFSRFFAEIFSFLLLLLSWILIRGRRERERERERVFSVMFAEGLIRC